MLTKKQLKKEIDKYIQFDEERRKNMNIGSNAGKYLNKTLAVKKKKVGN